MRCCSGGGDASVRRGRTTLAPPRRDPVRPTTHVAGSPRELAHRSGRARSMRPSVRYQGVTMSDLSAVAGVSERRVRDAFSDWLGMSPTAYLRVASAVRGAGSLARRSLHARSRDAALRPISASSTSVALRVSTERSSANRRARPSHAQGCVPKWDSSIGNTTRAVPERMRVEEFFSAVGVLSVAGASELRHQQRDNRHEIDLTEDSVENCECTTESSASR